VKKKVPQGGFLYACFFNDGSVKVGRSLLAPHGRLSAAANRGKVLGLTVTDTKVVTVLAKGLASDEAHLITLCRKLGTLIDGHEYFALDADGPLSSALEREMDSLASLSQKAAGGELLCEPVHTKNIAISSEVHKQVKFLCIEMGITISEFVTQALEDRISLINKGTKSNPAKKGKP